MVASLGRNLELDIRHKLSGLEIPKVYLIGEI